MDNSQILLNKIEDFCQLAGIIEIALSRLAVNDDELVNRRVFCITTYGDKS